MGRFVLEIIGAVVVAGGAGAVAQYIKNRMDAGKSAIPGRAPRQLPSRVETIVPPHPAWDDDYIGPYHPRHAATFYEKERQYYYLHLIHGETESRWNVILSTNHELGRKERILKEIRDLSWESAERRFNDMYRSLELELSEGENR